CDEIMKAEAKLGTSEKEKKGLCRTITKLKDELRKADEALVKQKQQYESTCKLHQTLDDEFNRLVDAARILRDENAKLNQALKLQQGQTNKIQEELAKKTEEFEQFKQQWQDKINNHESIVNDLKGEIEHLTNNFIKESEELKMLVNRDGELCLRLRQEKE